MKGKITYSQMPVLFEAIKLLNQQPVCIKYLSRLAPKDKSKHMYPDQLVEKDSTWIQAVWFKLLPIKESKDLWNSKSGHQGFRAKSPDTA